MQSRRKTGTKQQRLEKIVADFIYIRNQKCFGSLDMAKHSISRGKCVRCGVPAALILERQTDKMLEDALAKIK